MIKRALISVYDKSGLDEFAQGLVDLGAEIVSSGGTSTYLEEMGIPVTRIEELTQVPELLGGRVKTLHPRIHAAILARRDEPDDLSALEERRRQQLHVAGEDDKLDPALGEPLSQVLVPALPRVELDRGEGARFDPGLRGPVERLRLRVVRGNRDDRQVRVEQRLQVRSLAADEDADQRISPITSSPAA